MPEQNHQIKREQNHQLTIDLIDQGQLAPEELFKEYEKKFKALADQKRLHILYELCQRGSVCVCDMCELFDIKQSKLSYHLKILVDAQLIKRESKGTWSYYTINSDEVNQLLSEQLCCIFRPTCCD